jgi:hypothetical protein
MQAIADRNVDQAVLAANGHGWFRSQLGQREEPTALTATEDEGKDRTHVEG